jgi:YfiH family protein
METLSTESESSFDIRYAEVDCADEKAEVEYLECKPLSEAGFLAAFSTRIGGVSDLGPGGLNLGYAKSDLRERVDENRRRFIAAIGATDFTLVTARQTHSVVRHAIKSREEAVDPARFECDAFVTSAPGVLLGIQTADCLPVLIADPKTGAIAAIHAGWRGTMGRITERSIADLMQGFGVNPRNCIVALGPAACGECYEVGRDVIDAYKREFRYWRKLLLNFKDNGKAHLDIYAANVHQLMLCGVTPDRIYVAPWCTMHNNDLFYSYRQEGKGGPGVSGRALSVIGRRQ